MSDLPDLKRLADLEAFMRANGITHLKVDGIELNLGPRPAPKVEETEENYGKRQQAAIKARESKIEGMHRTLFAHSRTRPRRIDRTQTDRSDDQT